MTKAEIVSRVAGNAGLTKREADNALDAVVAAITDALGSEGRVRLDGLGVFDVVQRGAKAGRNMLTGARIEVPAHKAVRFRPTPALKAKIAG